MNRLLRLPMLLLWLTALWVALWGDVTAGNVVAGFVVAVGVLAVARPTGVTGLERYHFRPFAALWYAVYFLTQLVRSNLIVAWEIITPGSNLNRAIICVPMHSSSPGVVTLIANSITLTPGTVTVDVHEHTEPDGSTRRELYIHVLQLGGYPEVAREILHLERLAIKAFGEPDELEALEATMSSLERGAQVSR